MRFRTPAAHFSNQCNVHEAIDLHPDDCHGDPLHRLDAVGRMSRRPCAAPETIPRSHHYLLERRILKHRSCGIGRPDLQRICFDMYVNTRGKCEQG